MLFTIFTANPQISDLAEGLAGRSKTPDGGQSESECTGQEALEKELECRLTLH